MYIISEYAACVVIIFAVAALLFAVCATLLLFQEGGVAVWRTVRHIAEQWRQAAPSPLRDAMKQEG